MYDTTMRLLEDVKDKKEKQKKNKGKKVMKLFAFNQNNLKQFKTENNFTILNIFEVSFANRDAILNFDRIRIHCVVFRIFQLF